LVYFLVLVMLYQEKSGNPEHHVEKISFFIVKPLRFLRIRRRRNKKTCLVQIRLM
jgi:hypothetical protein